MSYKIRTLFASVRSLNFTRNNASRAISTNVVRSPFPDIYVPNITLNELIWKNLNKWGYRTAIQCAESKRAYTYNDLRKLSRRFSIALRKYNFEKGQVLAVILPNVPEYPVILLGSAEAGLVVTTFNPVYTAEEVSRQLQSSGASVVVTLPSLIEKVQSAKQLIERRTNSKCSLKLITLNDEYEQKADICFTEMIDQKYDSVVLSEANVTASDIAILPFSSGTTGFPKGVQLTHSNLVTNLLQLGVDKINYLQEATDSFQEVIPAVVPFFHIYGIHTVMLLSLLNGCKIITLRKFDPATYLNVIKEEKASVLYLVPTLVYFLTSHPTVTQKHFDRVRVSLLTGGSTPETEVEKLFQLSGNQMVTRRGYGLTETSPGVCMSLDNDGYSTVGQPLPNTSVKIIGSDGSAKSSYQRGEICVKGPQVMKGYFNNPDATSAVIDEDNYFHTGDVGYYNDDGKFFYVDRIKELIKVKGFQVPPAELESILKSHNGVNDVGVIGVPDKRCGEKPIAFVVPKNSQSFQENDLKRFVAEKVAPYKQLAGVVFVKSIPRNPSGKILRRILRENYANSI